MAKCPRCSHTLEADQMKVCLHCGYDLRPAWQLPRVRLMFALLLLLIVLAVVEWSRTQH